eukprot:1252280-Pleurochrysis_carterae.AAC.1
MPTDERCLVNSSLALCTAQSRSDADQRNVLVSSVFMGIRHMGKFRSLVADQEGGRAGDDVGV